MNREKNDIKGLRIIGIFQLLPALVYAVLAVMLFYKVYELRNATFEEAACISVFLSFGLWAVIAAIITLLRSKSFMIAQGLSVFAWLLFYLSWIVLPDISVDDKLIYTIAYLLLASIQFLPLVLYSQDERVKEYLQDPENKPAPTTVKITAFVFVLLLVLPGTLTGLFNKYGYSYASAETGTLTSSGDYQKYSRDNLVDEDLKTWWTPFNRDGRSAWVKFPVFTEKEIVAVEIHPGSHFPDYPKHGDLFKLNSRLVEAQLEFDDGTYQVLKIKDEDRLQVIKIKPKKTSSLVLRVRKTREGKKWNDLCVSEFRPLVKRKFFKEK